MQCFVRRQHADEHERVRGESSSRRITTNSSNNSSSSSSSSGLGTIGAGGAASRWPHLDLAVPTNLKAWAAIRPHVAARGRVHLAWVNALMRFAIFALVALMMTLFVQLVNGGAAVVSFATPPAPGTDAARAAAAAAEAAAAEPGWRAA